MPEVAVADVLSICRERWPANEHGELLVGGTAISDAVMIAGGTPAYVYDRAMVAQTVAEARTVLDGAELFYSVKANPFPPLLAFLAQLVDGFDVASGGELAKAVNAGKTGTELQFSGPGKDAAELRQAIAAGALLNVESPRQVEDAAAAGVDIGRQPNVVLRLNPGSLPGWSGLRMGGSGSQFGMDLADVENAVALCRARGIEPHGFHFYWGTQCLDGEKVAAAQQACWQVAQRLSDATGVRLGYLNIGGGFGIPYYRRDQALDLDPVRASIGAIRDELREREPGARLVVELGRYLVGPAGLYVTRVLDVKRSGEVTIAVTDGGMHQHLAASGNLGQGIKRSFPCYTPERMATVPEQRVRVVGRLCTPIDVLCAEALLPELRAGDLVAIFQSGAYGASASPQGFLGHEAVREILL